MNITGKTFSDIIKEAESKGIQIVLLEAGAEIGEYAELIANMSKKADILLVPIDKLPLEDQAKIQRVPTEQRNFLREITDEAHAKILHDIRNMRLDMDAVLSESKEKHFNHSLPKSTKPVRGYSGNFKSNFKGRKRH